MAITNSFHFIRSGKKIILYAVPYIKRQYNFKPLCFPPITVGIEEANTATGMDAFYYPIQLEVWIGQTGTDDKVIAR